MPKETNPSLLIIQRFPLDGQALGALLSRELGSPEVTVSCEVCEAVGLASSLIATNSCVLLLDGDLPDDGAARFLGGVAANLRRRTIVLAGSLAAADVADLLRAGAGGALSKRGQVSDLVVAPHRHRRFDLGRRTVPRGSGPPA